MFRFSKKKHPEDIEPHEILLDRLVKSREEKMGISQREFETPLFKRAFRAIFYFSILLFILLFLRTFQFQVIEGKEYNNRASDNKYIFHKIQAQRGVIYDQNLKQLVFNHPSFDLVCQKSRLPDSDSQKERVLKNLSHILKIGEGELKEAISQSDQGQDIISIVRNLDYKTLIILETRISSLPGFKIEENSIRQYPDGSYFSHLIGYMGRIRRKELEEEPNIYSPSDYVGRDGLEKSYEKVLRKTPGRLRIERDASGRIVSKKVISLPRSGRSLILYLDSDLEKKITDVLEKEVGDISARGAAAVALDPNTGGVLAMVSLPRFDNNVFSKGNWEEIKKLLNPRNDSLFNRAIKGKYLPGSTIKPLIASAALEEKIISANKKINDDKGYIIIPNPYDPSSPTIKRDWTIHGWTDMRKAIAESCDVYFYTIGGGYGSQKGLGPTRIKKYLEKFGWDEKTGIDLPGEDKGFIPDKEWKKKRFGRNWYDGDTYNLAIGQGFLQTTPLEVAASFLPIVNGGRLLKPQLVQKIVDGKKNVIWQFQPKVVREGFIDQKDLQVVREGMREAVTGKNSPHASATLLNSLPIKVAAKTGTAELGNGYYDNWVTVFAPYDNPRIVLTIVIGRVHGLKSAALPVAREVLNWYFSRPGQDFTKEKE